MNQSNSTGHCSAGIELSYAAAFYASISIVYTIPYIICLYIMKTDVDIYKLQYYRIVFHMGLTDLVQIVVGGLGIPFLVLFCFDYRTSDTNHWVTKLVGAILNSNWMACTTFAVLLSFNRLCSIFNRVKAEQLFNARNTSIMICASWLYGLAWFCAYLVPQLSVIYDFGEYAWLYDSPKLSQDAYYIETISDFTCAIVMIIFYALIVAKVFFGAKEISNVIELRERKREYRVLLQAVLICGLMVLTIYSTLYLPSLFHSYWFNIFVEFTWLSCGGMNVIVYISLNSTIRKKFKAFIFKLGA